MIKKKCLSLATFFILGSALSGCGMYGPVKPAEGVETTYPRQYPKPESEYPPCDELF